MAPKKEDRSEQERDAATAAFIEVAFDDAYRLREEYNGDGGFVQRRRANREQLRSLKAQGKLTPEQIEELEDLYPARSVKDQEAEEAAQAAEPAAV